MQIIKKKLVTLHRKYSKPRFKQYPPTSPLEYTITFKFTKPEIISVKEAREVFLINLEKELKTSIFITLKAKRVYDLLEAFIDFEDGDGENEINDVKEVTFSVPIISHTMNSEQEGQPEIMTKEILSEIVLKIKDQMKIFRSGFTIIIADIEDAINKAEEVIDILDPLDHSIFIEVKFETIKSIEEILSQLGLKKYQTPSHVDVYEYVLLEMELFKVQVTKNFKSVFFEIYLPYSVNPYFSVRCLLEVLKCFLQCCTRDNYQFELYYLNEKITLDELTKKTMDTLRDDMKILNKVGVNWSNLSQIFY